MPKSKPPKRIWYKGKRRTFREIASLEGVTTEAVRKWHSRHGNLADYGGRIGAASRWGRRVSWKNGEGMNIDTLFIRGRIDIDTYLRYLQEYERQTRHGKGHKAIGTIVDGKLTYRMTDREDYFNPRDPFTPLPLFDTSPDELAELFTSMDFTPDHRNLVVREVEDGGSTWSKYVGVTREPYKENWLAVGSVSSKPVDLPQDALEDWLDDCLGYLEDG